MLTQSKLQSSLIHRIILLNKNKVNITMDNINNNGAVEIPDIDDFFNEEEPTEMVNMNLISDLMASHTDSILQELRKANEKKDKQITKLKQQYTRIKEKNEELEIDNQAYKELIKENRILKETNKRLKEEKNNMKEQVKRIKATHVSIKDTFKIVNDLGELANKINGFVKHKNPVDYLDDSDSDDDDDEMEDREPTIV